MAEVVRLAPVTFLFGGAAQAELDEFDPERVLVPKGRGQIHRDVTLARARHAVVDLAQQADVGVGRLEYVRAGFEAGSPFGVERDDADRPVQPLLRGRAADVDAVEIELVEPAPVLVGRGQSAAPMTP